MEKITTKAELIEKLEDVKAVEISARQSYLEDISSFRSKKIVDTISEIKRDEDKHIAILEKLISSLKSGHPHGSESD